MDRLSEIKSRLARVVRDQSGNPRQFDGQLVDDAARLVAEVERLQVEAVSVVRCRDCRYHKQDGTCWVRSIVTDIRRFTTVRPDYYCADGERKEAEGQKDG